MSDTVLVIGGGIAGIQSSLDLAQAGARVLLVEKEATIGGKMAVLDKNFPTLDCSICIEAPKMSEVELHPNIEIMNLAEVTDLVGRPGAFQATIKQRAGYVTDECTRCDDCVAVCPVVRPNEYDSGLAARKAIYTPIPQAVPGAYIIDIESCLNQPPNYLPCDHCTEVCAPQAIDFLMETERAVTREVGSVVVAVGFDSYDPRRLKEYGYGTHPDILTALEYERLINSAGPTGGEILRPSDGQHPENILFVLCVGSRDQRHLPYCSRFCCMYSIKHAYQTLDHGLDDVTVLYMDMRAYGKGFDGFWERTNEAGARFIRGRPSEIQSTGDGRIHVTYEDTHRARLVDEDFEMVVLANAATPADGLDELASALDLGVDQDGFLNAHEAEAGLVMSSRAGVYLAGCASGPKDIPDSVSEGSGAAALALGHLNSRFKPEPIQVEPIKDIETPRVGVFVCHCGSNIAGVVDVARVTEYARGLPQVAFATHQMFSCTGSMQADIEEAIRREKLTRVVIAACSPKTHEGIFRGVMERSGLNPYLLEMANIRNMDSWVHKFDKEAATTKAMDMVSMAVEKARRLEPLEPAKLTVTRRSLVVGGGIAGMTAAIAIANQGLETYLVERSGRLGGQLLDLHTVAPAGLTPTKLIETKIAELEQAGVNVKLEAEVEAIEGVVGNFRVQLTDGSSLTAGALVLATGAGVYQPTEFACDENSAVITNLELERKLASGNLDGDSVTFISCIGSRNGSVGCSRYCCTSMINQALELRRRGKATRVLSKDIRTYSRGAEELYEQAMREGVQFFRYPSGQLPEAAVRIEDGHVELEDELLGQRVRIPTDLTVLVSGLTPQENTLADALKLARSEDGFLMELHPKLGPAETASQGIYLAGTVQGAKDVRESMAQGLAAAAKVGAILAQEVIEKEPLMAQLNLDACIACMRCVEVCPYGAIEQIGEVKTGSVAIHQAVCMGCGTCPGECNFAAIDMPYFTTGQIMAQIEAALADRPEEKCLVFTCNWCSYAGADLAGIEKRQYPTSARIIRTMCSGRFEQGFIERAFERGAGAVLLTGCRLTETGSDCHYNHANEKTWKRFQHWRRRLERKGIDPERFQLQWISAAEGKEFAAKIAEMDEVIDRHVRNLEVEREPVESTG